MAESSRFSILFWRQSADSQSPTVRSTFSIRSRKTGSLSLVLDRAQTALKHYSDRLIADKVNTQAMPKNQLYYGDNLEVLRDYIKDESVDLIYLDPPFNSRADYNVLFAEKDGTRSS